MEGVEVMLLLMVNREPEEDQAPRTQRGGVGERSIRQGNSLAREVGSSIGSRNREGGMSNDESCREIINEHIRKENKDTETGEHQAGL
jgi:hypothetical protein